MPPRDDNPRARGRSATRAIPGAMLAGVAASYALVAILPIPVYAIDLASQASHWVALALATLAALLALARRPLSCAVTLLSALAILAFLLHSSGAARPGPAGDQGHDVVRVVTLNAQNASSSGDRALYEWIASQQPDVLVVIDSLPFFGRHDEWINANLPHRLEPRAGLRWPIVILSRYPFEPMRLAERSPDLVGSFPAHRALRIVTPRGARFIVTAVHPYSPRSDAKWRTSLRQAERDGGVIARAAAQLPDPIVVAADQNSTPMGLVHRRFRAVSGLRTRSSPFAGTWPAQKPLALSFPIDRVWASPRIGFARVAVGPAFRSDHRPVVADLRIPLAAPGTPVAPGAAPPPDAAQPGAQPPARQFPES